MKNIAVKVLLSIAVISSIFLCVLLVLLTKKGTGEEHGSRLEAYQAQYEEHAMDTKTIAPVVYQEFSIVEELSELYDTARHTQVYERIENLKRTGAYTKDAPLVIYNPYGINTSSVYVYFKTDTPARVSYRVSVQESDLPTFSADCYSEETYTTVHEYLLLGITAAKTNRVALVMTDKEGNSCVRTFYVTAGTQFGTEKSKIDFGKGSSEAALSDGLFVHFGNETGEKESVGLYDNDGVLRGELALVSGSAKRLVFLENRMYYNISDTQFAAVDRFGRAECVYSTEGYTIGGDYCLDKEKKTLLVLASKKAEEGKTANVNDIVLSVNLISGEVKELLDMGVLLKEYKALCKKNEAGVLEWLNLNSIQLLEEDGILLGAREPSAAFKVADIYGIPMLEYIIGDTHVFQGTGYESYLLAKTEEFDSFFGANTLTVVREEGMPSGVYSFYLYDNHIGGTESRPDLDYSLMADDLGNSLKKGTTSYFCCYLVNETARTWEQTECIPVDYSGYMGSAQLTEEGHLITVTAGRFAYSEFDEERNLVGKYTASGTQYLGRVFKYTFENFYFAGEDGSGSMGKTGKAE